MPNYEVETEAQIHIKACQVALLSFENSFVAPKH